MRRVLLGSFGSCKGELFVKTNTVFPESLSFDRDKTTLAGSCGSYINPLDTVGVENTHGNLLALG